MARIRTVKPEFWVDEKIVELDPWERLLFIGLWNFADDQGFVDLSVKRIKMQIFPGDTYDVSVGLARLYRADLVACYQSPKGYVLHIVNWAKHQRVSNPAKERFKPSELRKLDALPESSLGLARSLESYPAEGKGKEGKGKEGSPRTATLPQENPPADVFAAVTVTREAADSEDPTDDDTTDPAEAAPEAADEPPTARSPTTAAHHAQQQRPRDRDLIDRAALDARIDAAAGDRAAQIGIAARIVAIWTDATEAEARRVADAIRLDRQPTNLAALVLTIADADELPAWVKRVRAEQPYRHGPTGALAQITRDPAEVARPPDLSAVRAQLADASEKHRATERPNALDELRQLTDDPDTED